jgi:hypothetical protein
VTGRRIASAFFLGLLFAATASAADGPLFRIYKQYVAAIDDGDLDAAKKFLSSGKVKTLDDLSDDDALAAIDVISPKSDLRQHKEIIDGDDATLIVVANVAENESAGRIQFTRESGKWKILSEQWDIGGNPDDAPAAAVNVLQPKTDEQRDAIRKLREKGFPEPTGEFMVMSAVTGDLEALKLFVQAGYSVDSKSQDGSPAIVSAAMFNHPEAVMYLIEAGADVNAVDGANTNALMRIADKCDATAAVKALLKAGSHTDTKSAGGVTAAQLAEFSQCKENAAAIKSGARRH